jgi:hypothetical protein
VAVVNEAPQRGFITTAQGFDHAPSSGTATVPTGPVGIQFRSAFASAPAEPLAGLFALEGLSARAPADEDETSRRTFPYAFPGREAQSIRATR